MTKPIESNPLLETPNLGAARRTAPKTHGDTPEAIDKAAKQFESMLLHQMMKSMWTTVSTTKDSLLGSKDEEMYRDMFNQSLADSISEGKGIGIKEVITKELKARE